MIGYISSYYLNHVLIPYGTYQQHNDNLFISNTKSLVFRRWPDVRYQRHSAWYQIEAQSISDTSGAQLHARIIKIICLVNGPVVTNLSTLNFRNGRLHNLPDLPAIQAANGVREWCQNGLTHRKDGPSQICDSNAIWTIRDIDVLEI